MENPAALTALPFVQPKPAIRWLAVIFAALGWYVSWQSFRVSSGGGLADPLLRAVCGITGGVDSCTSVLTSPHAYVRISNEPGVPALPTSLFGLSYFAFLGLWYLFVGPPTRPRRAWHLVVAAVALAGALYSAYAIRVMAVELHRWCATCLTAHTLNAGLLLLTIVAWPWRKPARPVAPHPSSRLALATLLAGLFLFLAQTAIAPAQMLSQRRAQTAQIENDAEFIRWDFDRQSPVQIPLYEDEIFAGSPDAPDTIVVFSDFQCPHCRRTHEVFPQLVAAHPELRIAFRYYPLDAACSSNPALRISSHASGCRAARAAEAARIVGGREAYLGLRKLLWDRQEQLPTVPYEQQTEPQRRLFEHWAAELGLDPTAFAAGMDAPEAIARVRSDVELGDRLGIAELPVVYLNGKRVRNWGRAETYEVLLSRSRAPQSSPTSQP